MSPRGCGFFIAGTDTGCGKTRVTVGLLRAMRGLGIAAIGMKPVAAGTISTDSTMINDDVVKIAAESYDDEGVHPSPAAINPYCFEPPISPNIAAQQTGIRIDLDRIASAYARLRERCGCVVVEGAGGWLCPIGPDASMADVAHQLALPVVMVVGMRLGCLNHALLTAQAIERAGVRLAGWIASVIEPAMDALPENLETLRSRLRAPHLAALPYAIDCASDAAPLRSAALTLLQSAAGPCSES
jgi:dethiobiotin synthetase